MSIVHPRLGEMLTGFAPSRCTIQEALTSTTSDSGHVTKVWTDVPMLESLRCQLKPAKQSEMRTSDMVLSSTGFRAALIGYYPGITTLMQAVIDGVAYNILGPPDHDSQHFQTYLTLELVET